MNSPFPADVAAHLRVITCAAKAESFPFAASADSDRRASRRTRNDSNLLGASALVKAIEGLSQYYRYARPHAVVALLHAPDRPFLSLAQLVQGNAAGSSSAACVRQSRQATGKEEVLRGGPPVAADARVTGKPGLSLDDWDIVCLCSAKFLDDLLSCPFLEEGHIQMICRAPGVMPLLLSSVRHLVHQSAAEADEAEEEEEEKARWQSGSSDRARVSEQRHGCVDHRASRSSPVSCSGPSVEASRTPSPGPTTASVTAAGGAATTAAAHNDDGVSDGIHSLLDGAFEQLTADIKDDEGNDEENAVTMDCSRASEAPRQQAIVAGAGPLSLRSLRCHGKEKDVDGPAPSSSSPIPGAEGADGGNRPAGQRKAERHSRRLHTAILALRAMDTFAALRSPDCIRHLIACEVIPLLADVMTYRTDRWTMASLALHITHRLIHQVVEDTSISSNNSVKSRNDSISSGGGGATSRPSSRAPYYNSIPMMTMGTAADTATTTTTTTTLESLMREEKLWLSLLRVVFQCSWTLCGKARQEEEEKRRQLRPRKFKPSGLCTPPTDAAEQPVPHPAPTATTTATSQVGVSKSATASLASAPLSGHPSAGRGSAAVAAAALARYTPTPSGGGVAQNSSFCSTPSVGSSSRTSSCYSYCSDRHRRDKSHGGSSLGFGDGLSIAEDEDEDDDLLGSEGDDDGCDRDGEEDRGGRDEAALALRRELRALRVPFLDPSASPFSLPACSASPSASPSAPQLPSAGSLSNADAEHALSLASDILIALLSQLPHSIARITRPLAPPSSPLQQQQQQQQQHVFPWSRVVKVVDRAVWRAMARTLTHCMLKLLRLIFHKDSTERTAAGIMGSNAHSMYGRIEELERSPQHLRAARQEIHLLRLLWRLSTIPEFFPPSELETLRQRVSVPSGAAAARKEKSDSGSAPAAAEQRRQASAAEADGASAVRSGEDEGGEDALVAFLRGKREESAVKLLLHDDFLPMLMTWLQPRCVAGMVSPRSLAVCEHGATASGSPSVLPPQPAAVLAAVPTARLLRNTPPPTRGSGSGSGGLPRDLPRTLPHTAPDHVTGGRHGEDVPTVSQLSLLVMELFTDLVQCCFTNPQVRRTLLTFRASTLSNFSPMTFDVVGIRRTTNSSDGGVDSLVASLLRIIVPEPELYHSSYACSRAVFAAIPLSTATARAADAERARNEGEQQASAGQQDSSQQQQRENGRQDGAASAPRGEDSSPPSPFAYSLYDFNPTAQQDDEVDGAVMSGSDWDEYNELMGRPTHRQRRQQQERQTHQKERRRQQQQQQPPPFQLHNVAFVSRLHLLAMRVLRLLVAGPSMLLEAHPYSRCVAGESMELGPLRCLRSEDAREIARTLASAYVHYTIASFTFGVALRRGENEREEGHHPCRPPAFASPSSLLRVLQANPNDGTLPYGASTYTSPTGGRDLPGLAPQIPSPLATSPYVSPHISPNVPGIRYSFPSGDASTTTTAATSPLFTRRPRDELLAYATAALDCLKQLLEKEYTATNAATRAQLAAVEDACWAGLRESPLLHHMGELLGLVSDVADARADEVLAAIAAAQGESSTSSSNSSSSENGSSPNRVRGGSQYDSRTDRVNITTTGRDAEAERDAMLDATHSSDILVPAPVPATPLFSDDNESEAAYSVFLWSATDLPVVGPVPPTPRLPAARPMAAPATATATDISAVGAATTTPPQERRAHPPGQQRRQQRHRYQQTAAAAGATPPATATHLPRPVLASPVVITYLDAMRASVRQTIPGLADDDLVGAANYSGNSSVGPQQRNGGVFLTIVLDALAFLRSLLRTRRCRGSPSHREDVLHTQGNLLPVLGKLLTAQGRHRDRLRTARQQQQQLQHQQQATGQRRHGTTSGVGTLIGGGGSPQGFTSTQQNLNTTAIVATDGGWNHFMNQVASEVGWLLADFIENPGWESATSPTPHKSLTAADTASTSERGSSGGGRGGRCGGAASSNDYDREEEREGGGGGLQHDAGAPLWVPFRRFPSPSPAQQPLTASGTDHHHHHPGSDLRQTPLQARLTSPPPSQALAQAHEANVLEPLFQHHAFDDVVRFLAYYTSDDNQAFLDFYACDMFNDNTNANKSSNAGGGGCAALGCRHIPAAAAVVAGRGGEAARATELPACACPRCLMAGTMIVGRCQVAVSPMNPDLALSAQHHAAWAATIAAWRGPASSPHSSSVRKQLSLTSHVVGTAHRSSDNNDSAEQPACLPETSTVSRPPAGFKHKGKSGAQAREAIIHACVAVATGGVFYLLEVLASSPYITWSQLLRLSQLGLFDPLCEVVNHAGRFPAVDFAAAVRTLVTLLERPLSLPTATSAVLRHLSSPPQREAASSSLSTSPLQSLRQASGQQGRSTPSRERRGGSGQRGRRRILTFHSIHSDLDSLSDDSPASSSPALREADASGRHPGPVGCGGPGGDGLATQTTQTFHPAPLSHTSPRGSDGERRDGPPRQQRSVTVCTHTYARTQHENSDNDEDDGDGGRHDHASSGGARNEGSDPYSEPHADPQAAVVPVVGIPVWRGGTGERRAVVAHAPVYAAPASQVRARPPAVAIVEATTASSPSPSLRAPRLLPSNTESSDSAATTTRSLSSLRRSPQRLRQRPPRQQHLHGAVSPPPAPPRGASFSSASESALLHHQQQQQSRGTVGPSATAAATWQTDTVVLNRHYSDAVLSLPGTSHAATQAPRASATASGDGEEGGRRHDDGSDQHPNANGGSNFRNLPLSQRERARRREEEDRRIRALAVNAVLRNMPPSRKVTGALDSYLDGLGKTEADATTRGYVKQLIRLLGEQLGGETAP